MVTDRAKISVLAAVLLLLTACGSDGVVVKNAYMRGVDLYDSGEYHEAIREYQAALGDNPDDYRVWYNMGLCYHDLATSGPADQREGLRAKAEEAYRNSARNEAGKSRAELAIARLLWDCDDRDVAMAMLQDVQGDDSIGLGAPAMTLGSMYLASNRIAEAEKEFKRALSLEENYRPAQAALAALYIDQGREAEADALLKLAVENHPYNLTLRVLHARLAESQAMAAHTEESWLEVLQRWQQAEAFAAGDWEVAAGLGRASEELGDVERALRFYWFARDQASDRALVQRGFEAASWRRDLNDRISKLLPRLKTAN